MNYLRLVFTVYYMFAETETFVDGILVSGSHPRHTSVEIFYLQDMAQQFTPSTINSLEKSIVTLIDAVDPSNRPTLRVLQAIFMGSSVISMSDADITHADWRVILGG